MADIELSEMDHLIIEVMALSYKIDLTTDYAVFVTFSGHVNTLRISIAKSKAEYQFTLADGEHSGNRFVSQQEKLMKLTHMRDHLQRLLETGDISACGMRAIPNLTDRYTL